MKTAIVGATGAVGSQLKRLIDDQNPICFASSTPPIFEEIDLAYFCVNETLAKQLIPLARKSKTICIDSSTAYRSDPKIPLIIPEINGSLVRSASGIIASPNCTTTLMLLPLAPLHKRFKIKRILATTYQAMSGAGKLGTEELDLHSRLILEGKSPSPSFFPHTPAFNVFPHESPLLENGYVKEEEKMHEETRKILEDSTISVSARCVRVPVFRVHCIALNVEFSSSFDLEEAQNLIQSAPGVRLVDSLSALDAGGQSEVFCSQVRRDRSHPHCLELWVAGDQLLKGAALNMVQIADLLCLR